MALFNGAQSFYVAPSAVANSTTMDIASIGMYFMYRPQAQNNKTGIAYPGITVFMTDVINDLPNMSNTDIFTNHARVEWNAILTSSDASLETTFKFQNPITVVTGKSYAFCWTYDGGEDFLPWTNTKGNGLVKSTVTSPGPSSSYGGSYFTFASISSADAATTSIQNYQTAWTALSGTDLKFNIYAARYAVNAIPIVANLNSIPVNTTVFSSNLLFRYISNSSFSNHIEVIKPSPRVENIVFDIEKSVKQSYIGAQRVYQNTINWPGGGVFERVVTNGSNVVTANSTMSNGAAFAWSQIYGSYSGDKFIVIDYGTSVDVRRVMSIVSNTVITLDEPTTAANSSAKFKISPVAVTDSFNSSFLNGKKASLMFMRDSNANSTVRFVGHVVDHANVSFVNAGTGYSNNDVLYVVGYNNVNNAITSNYPAIANLSTNSTGGVISVNWSNVGAGFVNTAQVAVVVLSGANATVNTGTANTSAGASLNMNLAFGATLITEQTNNVFRNSRPVNIDIHSALAVMDVALVSNTQTIPSIKTMYYMANNAQSPNGFITYVGVTQEFPLNLNKLVMLNQLTNIPVVVSRSLEFITHYANGVMNDQANSLVPYSNNFLVSLVTQSKNDFVAVGPFRSPLIDFGRYIINNDYTNEQGDYGNAIARHVTTVFNMSGPANTNQMAEDLRFWVSAWRPPSTDIQVYARIQNSTDSQPFSDEDWTRMTLIDGSNNYSTSSYVDLAYGFQGQPNTSFNVTGGTASVANVSTSIVFTNNAIAIPNNTLIKLYDPLFANQNFAVCLVTSSTTNATSTVLVTDRVFSTNTQVGIGGFSLTGRGGLSIDVLNFGHQGFNDTQTENVVRYYNQSQHVYQGFNTVQLKCVMLSPDPHNIPRIHNLRGIGVSA